MPALHHIAVEKLSRLIGTPGAPALIDVRDDPPDAAFVPGAQRRSVRTIAEWGSRLAGRVIVVIDEAGTETAQAAAAWLRSDGAAAETLEGGHGAWRAAGLPLIDPRLLPTRDADGRTLWVTRARPKVDRIACPWLIRRFVDPHARFLFVPPAQVAGVAALSGAAAFDIAGEGVRWSHRDERCTFDAMVDDLGLGGFPALTALAEIVRAADTDRLDAAPQAAGLLAVSLGLSRIFGDDLAQLDAGMIVYDALYRWCRDAQGESHDWTQHQPREVRA